MPSDKSKTTMPALYVSHEGAIRKADSGEIVASISDLGHISDEERTFFAKFIVDAVNEKLEALKNG